MIGSLQNELEAIKVIEYLDLDFGDPPKKK
jgi:hypothetical protein